MAAKKVTLHQLCHVLQCLTYARLTDWLKRNQLFDYDCYTHCVLERPKDYRPKKITIYAAIYRDEGVDHEFEECSAEGYMPVRLLSRPLLPEELWYEYEETYHDILSELRDYIIKRHGRLSAFDQRGE